jgi:hypothetical protein
MSVCGTTITVSSARWSVNATAQRAARSARPAARCCDWDWSSWRLGGLIRYAARRLARRMEIVAVKVESGRAGGHLRPGCARCERLDRRPARTRKGRLRGVRPVRRLAPASPGGSSSARRLSFEASASASEAGGFSIPLTEAVSRSRRSAGRVRVRGTRGRGVSAAGARDVSPIAPCGVSPRPL